MQQVNAELAHHRAVVHAERELRAEDDAALAEMDGWQRSKGEEALRESFQDRLDQRVEPTKERLISEAEARVGSRLLWGPGMPDGDVPVARPVRELIAEFEQAEADDLSE